MNKLIIMHGPQGCGKSRYAERIAMHLGCAKIKDDWNGTLCHSHGTSVLYIVTDGDRSLAVARQLAIFEIVSFAEVAQQINAGIKTTGWYESDTNPQREGRYECERQEIDGRRKRMLRWNGCYWVHVAQDPKYPTLQAGDPATMLRSSYDLWRGLAEEPIGVA